MRLAAVMIVACLGWTACSAANPSHPVTIEPGRPFSLRAGESAATRDKSVQVGFDGVTADSRCAIGEQCIVAGDAVVRVWLQRGAEPRQTRELRLTPIARDNELRLERLDPARVSGRPIARADYIATLWLTSGPAAAADADR